VHVRTSWTQDVSRTYCTCVAVLGEAPPKTRGRSWELLRSASAAWLVDCER